MKKKGTKLSRKVKAQRAATKRRVANALSKYLKQLNPARKVPTAVRVKKLKGGGVTITPVKAKKGDR